MSERDLIDLYLDRLIERLRGPGHEVRRAIAESEDHLREAQAEAMRTGLSSDDAAGVAVGRFGAADEVARRYDLMRPLASSYQVAAQALLALALVGGLILISIGVSGVLAAGGAALLGPEFIAGDLPGVIYTPDRCGDFLGFHPEAASCGAAAVSHHLDETVEYRLGAGVVGLLLVAGWFGLRQATRRSLGPAAIPTAFIPIAATALFAAATVILGGLGAMQWAFTGTGSGAGALLTAGIVSFMAAIVFGTWLVRSLRAAG